MKVCVGQECPLQAAATMEVVEKGGVPNQEGK